MNEPTRASVQRILDMFLRDEERHYEENDKPEDHIYLDLLALKAYAEGVPTLLDAAQGVLDSEDNTGCENCTVVDQSAIDKLETAVEAAKANAPIPSTQAGDSTAG